MSMKLKGMLATNLQALLESHMLDDAIVLENVPCEMTFVATQAYMENESEKNNYLPVFHIMGNVTEIHGDFPFHISGLYFDENDKPFLSKDCLYYPSPDELAHMITTGKYFSKYFKIPDILGANTYSFPALVNLTIIPPPNPVAYENATYNGGFTAETDTEKLNLPIVYVGLAGSGINRKNDKLLDYYGIDLDESFETYALTAESSGYTEPSLMMYFEEPEMVNEDAVQRDMSDYYITPEDEANLLKTQREHEQQAEVQPMLDKSEYQMHDMEDVIIAKADREINKRIDNRKTLQSQETLDLDKNVEHEKSVDLDLEKVDTVGKTVEPVAEPIVESKTMAKDDNMLSFEPEQEEVAATKELDSSDYIQDGGLVNDTVKPASESEYLTADDYISEQPVEEIVETESVENAEPVEDIVAKEEISPVEETVESESKTQAPDVPQQQADVKMDLNPESNTYVEQQREESHDLVDVESDDYDLQNMEGADVEDASLQAKIDEQHAKDLARDVAKQKQAEVVEEKQEDTKVDGKDEPSVESRTLREKSSVPQSHRDVTSNMQDVTDAYDAMTEDSNESELS